MRNILLKFIRLDKTTLLIGSFLIIFGSTFTIMWIEPETFTSFHDSLWWVMTTISTVGYGDISPQTTAGRNFAMLLYLVGIGVLGVVISLIANAMGIFKKRKEEGKLSYHGKGHIVIVGWSKKAALAIDEILLADKDTEIVLIDEVEKEPLNMKRVHYIHGSPMKKDVLDKANLADSKSAIVFATDCSDNTRLVDGNSLLIAAALEKNAPHIHTTVEVLDRDHVPMFKHSKVDEVILSDEFVSRMLVRSSFQKGVSGLFNQLISRESGYDLRQIERKEEWQTYRDVVEEVTSQGGNVIAVGENMDIYKHLDEPLPDGAHIRVVCDEQTYDTLC